MWPTRCGKPSTGICSPMGRVAGTGRPGSGRGGISPASRAAPAPTPRPHRRGKRIDWWDRWTGIWASIGTGVCRPTSPPALLPQLRRPGRRSWRSRPGLARLRARRACRGPITMVCWRWCSPGCRPAIWCCRCGCPRRRAVAASCTISWPIRPGGTRSQARRRRQVPAALLHASAGLRRVAGDPALWSRHRRGGGRGRQTSGRSLR